MHWIIVKRGDFEQYDRLYAAFGTRVPVIWDRRRNGYTVNGVYVPTDSVNEGAERRQEPPPSWKSLGFVVVECAGEARRRGAA